MSFEVTTAFVQQFSDNVQLLVQQKGSRLRETVTVDPNVVGKWKFYDQIGTTAARKVIERHGDSPLMSTPHRRRRVALFDYDWGDLVDDLDKVRMLNDPTSSYAQAAGFAMGRSIDDEIILAFFGTAFTGEDGTTQVTFPAGQQIAANFGGVTTGLTVEKLREARRILKANNVDMTDTFSIACHAKQQDNLLGTTQVTSSDYNTVKALVQGEVDTFMGFKFKQLERLPVDGSSNRRLAAYAKSGVQLGIGKDITKRMSERADKRYSMYVYYCMSIGATRMEEEKIVEIKCSES